MVQYYVYDEKLYENSPFYDTYTEAKKDLEQCISYKWSEDADIVEITVNNNSDNDTGIVFDGNCNKYYAKHYKTVTSKFVEEQRGK